MAATQGPDPYFAGFRIPMRGYESMAQFNTLVEEGVPNPHEGL